MPEALSLASARAGLMEAVTSAELPLGCALNEVTFINHTFNLIKEMTGEMT